MDHRHNRFVFLDGIRGMAAIFVLIRHTPQFWHITFFHSYLAVDLFFVLSGFVIANAYDEKLQGKIISIPDFIIIRLIRLYPVFFFSLILCAIEAVAYAIFSAGGRLGNLPDIAILILATALFIPSHLAGRPDMFPINSPYWSLFFELVVNLIYAFVRPVLTNRALASTVVCAGLAIALFSYEHGNIDEGFSWGREPFLVGFSRSVFGIFMGLLLHRHRLYFDRVFGSFISPWFSMGAIAIILALPSIGRFDVLIDLLSVIVIFPVCVSVASRAEKLNKFENILLTLGTASYPIYVLHLPLAALLGHWLKGVSAPMAGMVFVAALVLLSVWMERWYDIPLRGRLTNYAFRGNRLRRKVEIEQRVP